MKILESKAKNYDGTWEHQGCIIRQRGGSFQVETNCNGKRERHTEDSLKKAKAYAEGKALERRNEGASAFDLSVKDRRDAANALPFLPAGISLEGAVRAYADAAKALDGAPLADAIDFYLEHHRPAGGVRTVSELLTEYIDTKVKKGCRPSTILDIRYRIGKLKAVFGDRPVHTITPAEIEALLAQHGYKGISLMNHLRALIGFFNYAKKRKLVQINPAADTMIERPQLDEKLPQTFSVGNVGVLLQAAHKDYKRIVPFLALGFFAGIRTTEIGGVNWEDIDFDSKLITVRPEVAKKRRQGHVTMSDNLVAWLLPYRRQSGPVCPPDITRRRCLTRLLEATQVKWVHNGMRHTFASCHLAAYKDMTKTAFELRHTGKLDVLFNHYRNLVKPDEAEAYWKIYPVATKIVQFPAIKTA